ncbi:MAG TPA: thiamine phosphate synthase [Sphingomicrobium sp.]|nr:thiamine phosphate synthase [Sphingomicrobium sp.]
MKRRHTVPRQWLIADDRMGEELWAAARKLPKGSGILVIHRGMRRGRRARLIARLRRIANLRELILANEGSGDAARVHTVRELRQAGSKRVPLILLSPIHSTRSHPDRRPLPRMRAAALARLAGVPVIALGGMTAGRFARVERLGFHGWAGIDAFRT